VAARLAGLRKRAAASYVVKINGLDPSTLWGAQSRVHAAERYSLMRSSRQWRHSTPSAEGLTTRDRTLKAGAITTNGKEPMNASLKLESIGVDRFNLCPMIKAREDTLKAYGNRIIPQFNGVTARLLSAAALLAFAGCGGGSSDTQTYALSQPRPQCEGSKIAAQRVHARTRLNDDLRRLRVAAATVHRHTENGNATLGAALERFSLDVAKPTLPVHERSRFIDHAAAIVAPKCYLCFQTLEASRPIASGSKLPCD
jgi:hypothetical protein